MRRKFAALLAATLTAGVLAVLAPTTPASATLCAGAGQAVVNPGLLYPIQPPLIVGTSVAWNNPHQTSGWNFNFTAGGCTTVGTTLNTLTAAGTLQGYCGHSTGTGTDNAGHLIAWTSIGSLLLLTHEITGVVNAIPDQTVANNSCLHQGQVTLPTGTTVVPNGLPNAGALVFTVQGAAWRVNCTTDTLFTTLTTLATAPIPTPHLHASVHACVGNKL